jgi:hypothetical protein
MSIYARAIRKHIETAAAGLNMYTPKAWAVTTLAVAIGLAVIGLTTAIFDNPFFIRMTPVRAQDYVVWILSSVLMGLIVGSYFVASASSVRQILVALVKKLDFSECS